MPVDRTPDELYTDNPIVPDDDTRFVTMDAATAGASVFVGIKRGLSARNAVLVASTGNLTLSGEQTIDGVLTSTSRVLVKDQSTATQDGIYVSAAGAWARSADLPAGDAASGICVPVQRGTTYAGKIMVCTNVPASDVVGTHGLTFPDDCCVSIAAMAAFNPTNYTETAATPVGQIEGIDNALANTANGVVRHDANGDASIVRDLAVARNVAIEGDFVVNPLGVGGVNAATIDNDTGNFSHAGTLSTAGGNFTVSSGGNVAVTGTVDGRDVATDGTKLDGIEANADVTDATNVAAAGAVMTSRTVSTTAPLTGGGALSSNLTLAISAASDSATGAVELATQTEVNTGTDTGRVVTPATLANKTQRAPIALTSAGVGTYTISDAAAVTADGFPIRGDLLIDQQDAASDSMAYTVATAVAGSAAMVIVRNGQDAAFTGSGVTLVYPDAADGTAGSSQYVSAGVGSSDRAALLMWVNATRVMVFGGDV